VEGELSDIDAAAMASNVARGREAAPRVIFKEILAATDIGIERRYRVAGAVGTAAEPGPAVTRSGGAGSIKINPPPHSASHEMEQSTQAAFHQRRVADAAHD
jgi:hypothetical protein